MSKLIRLLIVTAIAGWLYVGCGGKPNDPPEVIVDYQLLYSRIIHPDFKYFLYLLDNDSFQIIDSLPWDSRPLSIDMEVTSSGRYLIWIDHYTQQLHCVETENWTTVATRQLQHGNDLSISHDETSLLAWDEPSGLVVAKYPLLTDFLEDSAQTLHSQFRSNGRYLYAVPEGSDYRLLAYDLENETDAPDTIRIIGSAGTPMFVRHLKSSATESLLFLATGALYGPFYFHAVDTDSFKTLLEFRVPFPLSFICEQPHRSKIYFGYYGIWEMWDQGTMYELDLTTMSVTKFLDKNDFPIINPLLPEFSPTDMLIEPNSDIAYIVNGGYEFNKPSGSVIVFNLATKEVIHTIELPGTFLMRLFLIKREFTKGE